MTCSSCRRQVIVAWHRDGTTERVCTGCIKSGKVVKVG